MENASKALIIAGAILLSILIIGLGMFIYTQSADAMKNTGLDQLEVQRHNDVFLQYEGSKVSGSNVRALVNKINANNRTYVDDTSLQIKINGATTAITTNPINTYGAGKAYNVKFGYNTSSGYIENVTIEEAEAK